MLVLGAWDEVGRWVESVAAGAGTVRRVKRGKKREAGQGEIERGKRCVDRGRATSCSSNLGVVLRSVWRARVGMSQVAKHLCEMGGDDRAPGLPLPSEAEHRHANPPPSYYQCLNPPRVNVHVYSGPWMMLPRRDCL